MFKLFLRNPLAFPNTTPREQQQFARRYAKSILIPSPAPLHPVQPPARRQRIRLGYLSDSFSTSATASLIVQVLELHNREQFEVFIYSYGPEEKSSVRARLKMSVEHFINLHHSPFSAMAQRIVQDGIDILVNLNGYSGNAPTRILAYHNGTIHVHWLGYPGTMGTSVVDYFVADHWIIPEGYQEFYDEKIVRLPHTYQSNDRKRPISEIPCREEAGLPNEGFVFCSLNQTYKITPEVFDVWMALLKEVPNSVLWLLESNPWAPEQLRRQAVERGVAASQLIFAPKIPRTRHLARFSLADLYLDTFPYNGHTTVSESLWVGVPVVTYSGETFASRVGGSLVRAIGCHELVTANWQDYFRLALELATKPIALETVRRKIKNNRLTTPLFDSVEFTRSLEKAYGLMWERHQQGFPPADISL